MLNHHKEILFMDHKEKFVKYIQIEHCIVKQYF